MSSVDVGFGGVHDDIDFVVSIKDRSRTSLVVVVSTWRKTTVRLVEIMKAR
jgi:hypothetical protein